jgi:hypothetical protein
MEAFPRCGYNILFCKRLDDPHCEFVRLLWSLYCLIVWCRMGW